MIIDALIDMLMTLLEWVLSVFDIPEMPPDLQNVLDAFIGYLQTGIAVLQNYVHIDYLLTLFMIIVVFDGCVLLYKGIMWVLRKIPMFGIS